MAKLQLADIGVYVKDLKAARKFYTKKIGLKERMFLPKWGYLALGATKGGEDASLNPWQPSPIWGAEEYEARMKMVGGVTGIGFLTNDLQGTVADLKRRGVRAEVDREGGTFGRFTDPDENVLFLVQPRKPKIRRRGLSSLVFVTVVSRDQTRSGEFFRKALGMRARRAPGEEGEEGFVQYQLSSKGTGIMPFTPTKEMYDNPADYDSDMAHLGEDTSIGFLTTEIYRTQDQLMAKGVRFQKKAEAQPWGGIQAKFLDPDDNLYGLIEYKG
jgi:catechol 2,3-dioxygenase-like lactoylglutathione lyase family enzyme